MRKMTHLEIRNMWLKFFESKGHMIMESSSLIPKDDDSLLWINAGVTPLKKYFDGRELPPCKRLTNIQKCIRTNDIENVGVTKRHQTFFEMMGNFSIGDYFRDEAISFAWELLTSDDYFAIPKEKLYVTIYTGDQDSLNKWMEVGMIPDHIIPLEGNFWEIGSGPCGPDSELFYDLGEDYDEDDKSAFEKFKQDIDQARYVEIWNNVFSQFNSEPGKKREEYKELPHKNIDTGAGLERWCMIFQGVDSNFETDLFMPLMETITSISGVSYNGQKEFKIIADHVRALTFAISDGENFSNNSRGYVLRRLLRRSVRAGKKLGIEDNFMYKLVDTVVLIMKDAYPYITKNISEVKTKILNEEKQFRLTLNDGERILKELMNESTDKTISGADAFKLYDTYGFPFELTLEVLEENGFTTSKDEFDKYMEEQKNLARKSNKNKSAMASGKQILVDFKEKSTFSYGIYRVKSKVIGIFAKDSMLDSLKGEGLIALKRTCLYAESGGQVSDTGMIIGDNFKARVLDVFKGPNGQNIHHVKVLDGEIHVDDSCEAVCDKERRKETEANHSSVHILHYILRTLINSDIRQAGSYVDNERLRLDFTSPVKLSDEDIIRVEDGVNKFIEKGFIVGTEVMPIDKAKKLGAMALFTEKYGDVVRVVKIGKSMEFCGGTHITSNKDIEHFAITHFESKGSNTYRIEAATNSYIKKTLYEIIKPYNDEMVKLLMHAKEILSEARELKIDLDFDVNIDNSKPVGYKDIVFNQNELKYVQNEVNTLEKDFYKLRNNKVLNDLSKYKDNIKTLNNNKYLIYESQNMDKELIKSILDNLVNEEDITLGLFINKNEKGASLIARTNGKINAGLLIKSLSSFLGAGGGGSNTFAEGGARDLSKLNEAIKLVESDLNELSN